MIEVTIQSQTCPVGHTFFPKVSPEGNIIKYERCPLRICRRLIDQKRVNIGKEKSKENLILGPHAERTGSSRTYFSKRDFKTNNNTIKIVCKQCGMLFEDSQALQRHINRRHIVKK